jgi:hypothetical protein
MLIEAVILEIESRHGTPFFHPQMKRGFPARFSPGMAFVDANFMQGIKCPAF